MTAVVASTGQYLPTVTPRSGRCQAHLVELLDVLAVNVHRLRAERGLSQEAMANELGYHGTWWSQIERGQNNLTLRSLE